MNNLLIFFHYLFEFFARVHYSCMISSRKNIPNAFICIMKTIFQKIHSHLSWNHIFLFSILRKEHTNLDSKMSRNCLYKIFITTLPHTYGSSLCKTGRNRPHCQFRETIYYIFECWWSILKIVFCDNLIKDSLDFTNIRSYIFCDKLSNFCRKKKLSSTRFFLNDSQTSLIIRLTKIHCNSPLESAL